MFWVGSAALERNWDIYYNLDIHEAAETSNSLEIKMFSPKNKHK